ncbi:hypothetical protein HON01_02385 [Candidatus Woesearchaeota archaeon]|nr:hypothetical protein [Candidatus Woesearchaeota archaeon]
MKKSKISKKLENLGFNKTLFINSIALLMAWLMILLPVYTAEAFEITFNQNTAQVTPNTAWIAWTTDEAASSGIVYGLMSPPNKQQSEPGQRFDHSMNLTNLQSDKTYYYWLFGVSESGENATNKNNGEYYQFKTLPPPDGEPPKQVDLEATSITKTEITLTWEPNVDDKDIAKYNVYKTNELIGDGIVVKTFTDVNLTSGVEYSYEVAAVDITGNEGEKSAIKVKTLDQYSQEIIISELKADVTGVNVLLTWNTNNHTSAEVKYGPSDSTPSNTATKSDMSLIHNVTLSNLQPNKEYAAIVQSCDSHTNCGIENISFTTSEKIELKLEITNKLFDNDPNTILFHNSNEMDIVGESTPGAEVDIYVDGKAKRFSKVGSNGLFSFKKVGLTPGAKQTEVKITATDKVNLVEFIEKVQLDLDAPNVQLDNISTFSGEANLEIKGNLTDDTFPIKVLIQKIIPDDSTPPAQVVNMSELEASDNSIQLSWSAPADYDLQKFIVYRNNVFDVGGLAPIATVEKGTTKYTDSKVSSNTEYEYAVSALDTAGNEGQKSDSITVLTLNGTASKDPIVQLKPEDIRSELTTTQEITKSGKFSVSVALNEGKNDLQIMFVDDAGNKYEYQISVMHDSTPPNILTPTSEEILSRFSPSYTSEIPFTGQVDSNATVKIWINPGLGNKTPSYEIQTDESGIFSVDLTLSRDKGIGSNSVDTAITSTNFQLGGDDGSENVIRVIAVDAAGQESEPVESTILYTSCGSGYFFNPDIKKVGAILNSREIIEGIAATGFEYVLSWVGGSKGARITNIRVEPAKLSEHDLIKYDPINEWLTIVNPPYHPMNNWSYGSVLLNFKQPLIEGNTTFEKEKNISNHRRDECMPGFGCFKFKLMMTIDFQRNDAMIPQQTAGGETWMEPTTQKTCIDFNVLVDERIDPSILPQNFLKATVDFLDTAIDALEGIQEPIKKITQIVWAICLVSMLAKLVMNMKKEYVCKFQSAISSDVIKSTIKSVLGVGMTVEDVASYGGCEYEFKSKDQGTYDVCMECSEAIKKKWKIDKLFTMTCDRIFCPAVITMQHFIKENRIAPGSYSYSKIQGLVSNPVASETGTAPAEAEESQPKTVDLSNHKKFYTYQDVVDSQGGKLNKVAKTLKDAKTDCAFANPTRSTIKELFYLFEYGENEKDDHVQFFSFDSLPDGKTLKQACEEPHPPQAACCPFDYNRIWQWGAVFVNEVKQSYCMTDRKADECSFGNSLLESVAGLCEPDKKTNTYAEIPQDLAWYKSTQFNFGGVMAGKPKVYYKIEYDDSGRLTGVHRGFIVQDTVLEANDAKKEAEKNALLSKVNSDDVVEIQNQNRFIYANRASNLVEAFDVLDPSNVENEEEVDMDAAIDKFYQDLKYEPQPVTTYGVTKMGEVDSVVGKSSTVGEKPIVSFVQSSKGVSGSNKYIERLYEEVAGITGSTDDKYIADPRNSFIQSLFTLCLRAIVAWIQHLINFMLMLKQCFETIMLTGDGSAGVCQNLISQYICDLFYELISCLVKSVGGHGQEQGIGGIGGIFAAMQTGSQSVTDDVAGRYGESNFFSQQLTAQNLVHDLCIWAFTGE